MRGPAISFFGDDFRTTKMVVVAVLLAFLGWHHARFSVERPEGYRAFLASPENHDGDRVLLPLWEVTEVQDDSFYRVSKSVVGVPIVGETVGLELGDTVTIIGHFRASDGAVLVRERIDHPWRKTKGLLSVLALVFAFAWVPKCFGWSSGRVVLRG